MKYRTHNAFLDSLYESLSGKQNDSLEVRSIEDLVGVCNRLCNLALSVVYNNSELVRADSFLG